MDPVSLVVAALVAGASTGLGDTVAQGIKDAYTGLKNLIKRKVADQPDGELIADKAAAKPETWKEPLIELLTAAGVSEGDDVYTAANQLMGMLDETTRQRGVTIVTASGTGAVAVGGNVGGSVTTHANTDPDTSRD